MENINTRFINDIFCDLPQICQYSGLADKYIRYIEDIQLLDKKYWKLFVEQFKKHTDDNGGWKGEFWGKMMRGACLTYSYTQNPELYSILEKTVCDLMSVQEKDGRLSTYSSVDEFRNWDIWCRKYVILGMEYFIEICRDEKLIEKIKKCICAQVDYIISKIGDITDGKLPITSTSEEWSGLNSSSILEPVIKLYNITNDKRYLEFATHIVECGGCKIANIFELAFENKLYPYQYPVQKAYEMISCFDGLLEYYRVTGIEKHKESVINFADKLLESDFTVIGCSGCTHELFDNSTVKQAVAEPDEIMQETCVTVTLMKFFYQLTQLTGLSKYADAFEVSYYNAYLGSININKNISYNSIQNFDGCKPTALPFDSYSPLTVGSRGMLIGGFQKMQGRSYYGCCACIGALGNGLLPRMSSMAAKDGIVINMFISGVTEVPLPSGGRLVFKTKTEYPKFGKVRFQLFLDSEKYFEIYIRNPEWSKNTVLSINGIVQKTNKGYIRLYRLWKSEDVIELDLDMFIQIATISNKFALVRGPITLAKSCKNTNIEEFFSLQRSDGNVIANVLSNTQKETNSILEVDVLLENGEYLRMTDYASAGQSWSDEDKVMVWMNEKISYFKMG